MNANDVEPTASNSSSDEATQTRGAVSRYDNTNVADDMDNDGAMSRCDAESHSRHGPPAPQGAGYAAVAAGRTSLSAAERPSSHSPQAAPGHAGLTIPVDGGYIIATANPMLTDAAADVLWRVIEKAMRKEQTE